MNYNIDEEVSQLNEHITTKENMEIYKNEFS
jgi:hypothetical protein